LLSQLHQQFPDADLYGIDGSQDMLLQARQRLSAVPSLRLEHAIISPGKQAEMPFPSDNFDLITCTNALHNLADPANFLADLVRLLASGGWLAIEDYARRSFAVPWRFVEWLALRIEGSQGRALTQAEAEKLCEQAGLHIERSHTFVIDMVFHGWVILVGKTNNEKHSIK
jgi:ubiquinone/menaquinone biosynthesis C-methylase UbiE